MPLSRAAPRPLAAGFGMAGVGVSKLRIISPRRPAALSALLLSHFQFSAYPNVNSRYIDLDTEHCLQFCNVLDATKVYDISREKGSAALAAGKDDI
jgi:hypothetical protein